MRRGQRFLGAMALALLLVGAAGAPGPVRADVPEAEEAWKNGDREASGRLVRDYVRRHPESVRSVRVAALLARTAVDPTEAIGRWDEVLALDPDGALAAEARWNRGMHAYSAGLYVAAGQEFALLAASTSGSFDPGKALLWKGFSELGADRPEEAIESFTGAESTARDRADVRSAELGVAHAVFRLGRLGEAMRRYEEFEKSHPEDGRASTAARRRVECLKLLGRQSDAAREAVRIERDYPDSREATLARAEIRGIDRAATAPPEMDLSDAGHPDGGEGEIGPFVVQAAAMTDPRNAAVLRREIRGLHVGTVTVEPGDGPDGPVHRVIVGPYDTEAEARAAAEAVATLGDLNPRVRPVTAGR